MDEHVKRRKTRHHIDTLMVYSEEETKNFKSAKMYNFSTEGVYFEAENKVEPGSDIVIKVGDYMPGPYTSEGVDTYHAKVEWCKELEGSHSFGIGATFTRWAE